MPRFRYEAVDAHGVPIHGTIDAVDQAALQATLAGRRQNLVSVQELSLDSLIAQNQNALPRLYQLRLGEQLRDALLTGLPAHEAVRSVAAEPLSHPIPAVMPWLQVTATVCFLLTVVFCRVTGTYHGLMWATGIFAIIVVPMLRMLLVRLYVTRPRKVLFNLARQLESGESLPNSLNMGMPTELRCVMNASVNDSSKARVAADLIPSVLGGSLLSQQFVLTMVGPIIMFALVAVGFYTSLLFVVTKFGKIFNDFGTDLPWMTAKLMGLADLVDSFGITGWLLFMTFACAAVIGSAYCLASGKGAEFLESIPMLGVTFRWAMQAKVARILASMIRNDCPYPESVRTATAGSGFESVKLHGEMIARELESRSGRPLAARKLSGLPLSMLFVSDSGQNESERRSALAATFLNLSEMLQSATLGQGRLLAVIAQFIVISFTGFTVAFGVLAMFLPLIKLLNDLS